MKSNNKNLNPRYYVKNSKLKFPNKRYCVSPENKTFDDKWSDWLQLVKKFYNEKQISPLFVNKESDNRPFLEISINNNVMEALLDTGASQTVLGKKGFNSVLSMDLEIQYNQTNFNVTTADGQSQQVIGIVNLPITLRGMTKTVKTLIIPSIKNNLILGVDFCKLFGLNLDFPNKSFAINDLPTDLSFNSENFLCSIMSESDLSNSQKVILESVIKKFEGISSTSTLGCTTLVEHQIELTESEPFKQRNFSMSPYMQKHLNAQIDEMLRLGVITTSKSPYSSNVILVKKPSGEYRLCFDGRRLNSITKKDSYPLPNLTQTLDKVRDAHFLTAIDLKHAFWQIKLTPDSREKTAFSVIGKGHFEFTRMPFGLCNSAQQLQRLIDRLFDPSIEQHIFTYLDDLVVVNKTFDEHIETLLKVFNILKSANLTVNVAKCKFCKSSLSFLGYIVDKDGLHPNPDKVQSIVDYPRPKNTTEVKRFLGMASWYRRFIQDFSELTAPITELIKGRQKRQSITWTDAAEKSFEVLKQRLITAPVLASPNFDKPFVLQCDASNYALGCVLTQGEGENERVVSYASRTLTKPERNYTVTELELLSLVFGVSKFRCYIQGVKFKVITDHSSLLWLKRLQNPSGRLARWAVHLSQYDFDIEHRSGKLNVVPDALSRAVANVSSVKVKSDKWYQNMIERVNNNPELYPQWYVENNNLYKYVRSKHNINTNFREWKLVIPKENRLNILKENHDSPLSAHFGCNKTYNRVCGKYYWPGMKSDIKKYVYKCEICNQQKVSQLGQIGLMGAPKNINQPFQLLSCDIAGPYPKSKLNNCYLLVVIDWFTKFTFIHRMKRATAKEICSYIENHIFLTFGVPQVMIQDNGSQFISKEFKSLLAKYSINHTWYNARYHPQVNNVERANRVIGTAIRSYIKENHREWDELIPQIANAINTSVHEVTGYSPAMLNFGRELPISGDYYGKISSKNEAPYEFESRDKLASELQKLPELYKEVANRISRSYQRNQKYYNLRKRNIEFNVGDTVYKKNYVLSNAGNYFSSKLAPKFIKCFIRKKISPIIYELVDEDNKNLGRYHVKDLKEAPDDDPNCIR